MDIESALLKEHSKVQCNRIVKFKGNSKNRFKNLIRIFLSFSLNILEKLSGTYPEILPEIKSIIDACWNFESASFRSRARKILNRVTVL